MNNLAQVQDSSLVNLWEGVELRKIGLVFERDLPYEQWEAIGERLRFMRDGVQWWLGDWVNYGEPKYGEKYAQALEATDYEYRTLIQFAYVAQHVQMWVRNHNLSWAHHKAVASLDSEDQAQLLAEAEREHWTWRQLRLKVAERRRQRELTESAPISGRYRVILADPPWAYSNVMPDYFIEQADHYEGLTPEEVAEVLIDGLPVAKLADENAVLFLWVTSPILEQAFAVVDAWGFEYKASFVWDKIKHNMGHYNSVRHEFLLVCVRGSCQPDVQKLFDSVVTEERTEHSRKPETFRHIIETLYPNGNRIELFARGERHDGWEAWGNEVGIS